MARTKIDLDQQSDLPLTEENLTKLGDNSIVDDLHRHSKLVSPDGQSDPAVWVDNDGLIHIAGNAKLENNSPASDSHLVTVGYVKSRGGKLVANAWLEMENNYNWPGWNYLASDGKAGKGCLERTGYLLGYSSELIPIDTSKLHVGSVWLKSVGAGGSSRMYIGVICYDKNGNNILAKHYYHSETSETTLAQELKNGETQVALTDNAENFAGAGELSCRRYLGIYDNTYYNENFGDYYYTQNTVHYASVAENTLTLDTPWSGGTIPAGTKVANNQNCTGTYLYSFGANVYPATTWTNYSGKINGVAGKTEDSETKFRHGTAFIKLLILANYQQDNNYTVRMDGFTLFECDPLEWHSDITISAIGNGELLLYDNGEWKNQTLVEAGIAADTGTSQASFQIDSGESGSRIKHSSGALICRNAADDANADFQALNIAATGGLYAGGTAADNLVITSGKALQNIAQATIGNIGIDGANIGPASDPNLLTLATDNLTINGAMRMTGGLTLPLETTLVTNNKYNDGECWLYYDSGSDNYYLLFKDEDSSAKAVQLNSNVTLT